MKKVLLTLVAALPFLLNSALARSIPLSAVFPELVPGTASFRNLRDEFQYRLPLAVAGAKPLVLQSTNLGSSYMEFLIPGETQTAAQKKAVGQFAGRLAIRCFNLLPARQAAIVHWVSSQLNLRERSTQAFGPLVVTLDQTVREPFLILSRSAPQAGQAPWLNYCENGG